MMWIGFMDRCVARVRTPSRLHFGLFSFGGSGRQYGGVGVMVRPPAVELTVCSSARSEIIAPDPERIRQSVRRWVRFRQLACAPGCRIHVQSVPPAHAGLGSGTQLALAVAAGLNAMAGFAEMAPAELAAASGRGQRSAVGTHGFMHGGLIVERGKLPNERLAPLQCRLAFPTDWRFVLVCPKDRRGLFGSDEQHAFDTLAAVSSRVRGRLIREVLRHMVPAVEAHDFGTFSASLHEYSRMAGTCFAPCQGGPYNGARLTRLVEEIRASGVEGVGQSSWGPTLFAAVRDQDAGIRLRDDLRQQHPMEELSISVVAVDNLGAAISREQATSECQADSIG